MEKKKEIITCQPRICSFLCSLARYVGSLFPLVLIYTTRATLMTLMKFISSTCYTQYYRKVYIQCQIRTLEHAIRGKTINRLFFFFSFVFCLRMPYWTFGQTWVQGNWKFTNCTVDNVSTVFSMEYLFSKWNHFSFLMHTACTSFWILRKQAIASYFNQNKREKRDKNTWLSQKGWLGLAS